MELTGRCELVIKSGIGEGEGKVLTGDGVEMRWSREVKTKF